MPQILPMSIYLMLTILMFTMIFTIVTKETNWKKSFSFSKNKMEKSTKTFFLSLFI
uniref:ATP synthase subunit 8 n=1 Tax=Thrips imaginis TaxID=159957 RepID=Q8HQ03_THRIM|nr:ATP synthase subunit 8 [Thrips imaginis]